MQNNDRNIRLLAVAAGVATVALTIAAFALSYRHLHTVAVQHGVTDGVAAWAWPGTVDTFIIAGELLVLRAVLRGVTDGFAVFLTFLGSVGSIALNVAGVGAGHGVMDYTVAAVPPAGALVAFGAVMRQVHEHLKQEPVTRVVAETAPVAQPVAPVVAPIVVETPAIVVTRDETASDTAVVAMTQDDAADDTAERLDDTAARRMAEDAYALGVSARQAAPSVTRSHATVNRWFKEFKEQGVPQLVTQTA